ncbi:hypothetical protein BOTNAR_0052g00380 [Botryotinia narcissicola]|uniref:Uncharacterized protein n=1 Tax=Botryotinia narcissicola TaxID=278944 RepID=A0A4Z1IZY5_9HELO|nr:hypothetical protein BOTNAR_0052g00380 [Botryotinia narcissicola]
MDETTYNLTTKVYPSTEYEKFMYPGNRSASNPAPVDMTQPRGLDAVFDCITQLKLKNYLIFLENSLATRNKEEENLER